MASSADGFDAVVVGAGPNGLVAAVTLAEAGRRVLLVEAADRVGGALRSAELTLPGFVHDVGATVFPLGQVSPAFRALALRKDEVRWVHPPVAAAHPLDGGAALVYRSCAETVAGLGAGGPGWRRTVGATAAAGTRLTDAVLSPLAPRRALAAGPALIRFGLCGAPPAAALARTALRDERSRALFAGMAAHSMLSFGTWGSAGYGILLGALAHLAGWPLVEGGSERLAEALAARIRAAGGEIHTRTPVTELDTLPPARSVLLDLTPRQVLALGGTRFPPGYRRRLSRFRYGPGVFKIDYALDGPLPWSEGAVAAAGTVHVGGTYAQIARAEQDVARGRVPRRPFVLAVQPTVADPGRAPHGKHILWAYCHVPHGSSVDMTDRIESQLERFAPGFRDRVLARHVSSPARLEAFDANLVGGDLGGGAADLRQFVARPVLARQPWATPTPGLYLCSASTPPGAGVHGMGGWHAAHLALRN